MDLKDLNVNTLIKFRYKRSYRKEYESGTFIGMFIEKYNVHDKIQYEIGHPVCVETGHCSCAVLGIDSYDSYEISAVDENDAKLWAQSFVYFLNTMTAINEKPFVPEKLDMTVLYIGKKFSHL